MSEPFEFHVASDDASFRRYFRVRLPERTLIAVDAPPERENSRPFIDISRRLLAAGLVAPEVLAADLEAGFMLLTDLGLRHYADALAEAPAPNRVDALYRLAIRTLHRLGRVDGGGLPPYDEALLMREMSLFGTWFLGELLERDEPGFLADTMRLLGLEALQQPARFVHRDYHSRNLMLAEAGVGLLDFQDAVLGPVTYDLVSLLRDCYVKWPEAEVRNWALAFRAGEPELAAVPEARFLRWFDWMGVQRHLKCAGIFCRLYFRDGKPKYLADIPRVLDYLSEAGRGYPELARLTELIDATRPAALPRLRSLAAATPG